MTEATPSPASILACWDPSADISPAVEWAARTAKARHRKLVLYTSFSKLREMLPADVYHENRRAHEVRMEAFIERAAASGLEAHAVVSNDDIRVDVLTTAERQHAELIVAGVEGRTSGPGLLHLGSVTEFLAHHSDLPLAVIRSFPENDHLAVLVDGTENGVAAVRWAAIHAGATGDEVTPVVVDAGVAATRQLADSTEAESATLVVVGAPTVGEHLGRRVGGTAMRVLHRVDRSIVIVPQDREAGTTLDHGVDAGAP